MTKKFHNEIKQFAKDAQSVTEYLWNSNPGSLVPRS
jgi:hypothetical protein